MRLIDADALGIGKAKRDVFENPAYADGWNSAIEIIDHAPTIDPEELRPKGRWIHDINNLYGCSECLERETMPHKKLKNYCPNCGAKMDGE